MKKIFKDLLPVILPFLLIVCVYFFATNTGNKKTAVKKEQMTHSEFLKNLKENKIAEVTVSETGLVKGKLKPKKTADGKNGAETDFTASVLIHKNMIEEMEKRNITIKFDNISPVKAAPSINFFRILDIFGTVLWITVLVMMFKNMRGGIDKFGIGKSNAKEFEPHKQTIRFKDVLGIDEAKRDVSEIIDFLSDPEKYSRLGAKIPKGVLLVGPPGTGKTLLAKAIAGEAGVPFLSTSGSEFVEMFVGVGASRVRSLFEEANKNAPCLIFIDEIDAVGRHRGSGYGGGNDEREQTLNQLLVEMDGFESNKGVIVIAATNRVDVLDTALLRAGRFDRQIYIDLPDLKGREAILTKYMNEVKILSEVDPLVVARGTPGFSGADLANLVNESALIAARFNRKSITKGDFEYARDKILMGAEKKSKTMTKEEISNTAHHEAGHAYCSVVLPQVDPIHKATIVPRGRSLGLVQNLPERDKVSVTITEIKSDMAVAMAGRICEGVFFGEENITTGASSDFEQATNYARRAITEWGFSKKIGQVCYKQNESYKVAEETQREIDLEVKKLVDEAYKTAYDLIVKNKDTVSKIAQALIKYETLTGDEIRAIVKGEDISIKKDADIETKVAFIRQSSFPITEKIEKKSKENKNKQDDKKLEIKDKKDKKVS